MSPEGHVFQRVGDCCIWCGVRRIDVAVPRLLPADRRMVCPGGPDTNIVALTHIIAANKLAALLHWNRPFNPSAG